MFNGQFVKREGLNFTTNFKTAGVEFTTFDNEEKADSFAKMMNKQLLIFGFNYSNIKRFLRFGSDLRIQLKNGNWLFFDLKGNTYPIKSMTNSHYKEYYCI